MKIQDFIEKAIGDYPNKTITVVEGFERNQYEVIKRAVLYPNAIYENGQEDSLGKRKPFHEIFSRLLNKQRTAEEIDTKNIEFKATRPTHYAKEFLMTLANRDWMNRANFALTLNEMTETRGRFGGVLVKKIEDEDMLNIEVVDWVNSVTEPADIINGAIIIRKEFTPADLLKTKEENGWGLGQFEGSIENAIEELSRFNQANNEKAENRDTMTEFIEVFETHGTFPKDYIESEDSEINEDDKYKYSRQTHITVRCGEYKGILFQADEVENLFMYLPYVKIPRCSLGAGIVETGTEAQIWINDAKKKEKDAMDFAGKVFIQTADTQHKGKNVFKNMETGTVLNHAPGKPFTGLNVTPGAIEMFQQLVDSWYKQVNDATSTQDSNTGANMPANTPFRLVALQNQEANSIFELRTEEMGIFIGEMYKKWVIPYLKKMISKKEYLSTKLTSEELQKVVKDYAEKVAEIEVNNKILDGYYDKEKPEVRWAVISNDILERTNEVLAMVGKGSSKYVKFVQDFLDDIEFDINVIITDEQKAKAVYLESILSILNTLVQHPEINDNPRAKKLFDEIMDTAGFSPTDFEGMEVGNITTDQLQEMNTGVRPGMEQKQAQPITNNQPK